MQMQASLMISMRRTTNLYNLVIAEKPSVAQSIARVLGAAGRQDGYLEGNGYLVSWCVGHLVELAEPESYDEKYQKWRKEDLPIAPGDKGMDWKYQVADATKKQYQILAGLMKRDDVDVVTNACDAGREGELIFRLVYNQCRCSKSIKRLWISSMEDEAIQNGFDNLRDGSEYESLYAAALCRERADWIVGMNATRLFSCLYGQTLNVGRVMTAALALTVERQAAIKGFVPESFYTVVLSTKDGRFTSERIKDEAEAEQLKAACEKDGEVIIIEAEKKEKQEKAPELFDLTSLQREANRRYGFTAQQTLDYAQSLYEKKLISYPRTDAKYLTDDMEGMLPELISKVQRIFTMEATKVQNLHQTINSKKVTDHHAIIPTGSIDKVNLEELQSGEKSILRLIAARLLEAVSAPCRFFETEIEATCGDKKFKAKGKQIIDLGWKAVNPKKASEEDDEAGDDSIGADIEEGRIIPLDAAECKAGKTTPPKSFTEDTLLSAMEKAGAKDTPEDAERKGLGTPATRAGIIEKLVRVGFIERKGEKKTKYLIPTHKGESLITVVPESLQSPSMTSEWEQKLYLIERDQYGSKQFMDEINEFICELVENYEIVEGAEVLMHPAYEPIGRCPCCQSDVTEKSKGFFCSNKDCKFALWKDNRFFDSLSKKITKQIAEQLLSKGNVKLKKCRSIKTGKTYDATVTLTTNEAGQAVFGLSFDK